MRTEAIIATVFDPPTLGPLVDHLKAKGVTTHVIEGMPTNAAWNVGLSRLERPDHLLVLNDDIVVQPEDWLEKLAAHHKNGYVWLHPAFRTEIGHGVIDHNNYRLIDHSNYRHRGAHAMHLGHLISMSWVPPPVPDDLQLLFGDDWFYWHSRSRGRCGTARDVRVLSGNELAHLPGFENLLWSGFSTQHKDVEKILGTTLLASNMRDHIAYVNYFHVPGEPRSKDMFCGRPIGLRHEFHA